MNRGVFTTTTTTATTTTATTTITTATTKTTTTKQNPPHRSSRSDEQVCVYREEAIRGEGLAAPQIIPKSLRPSSSSSARESLCEILVAIVSDI